MMGKTESLYVKGSSNEEIKLWASQIKVGQELRPKPLWNDRERWNNRLSVPSEVLGVKHSPSQTGIQFKVRAKDGAEHWLDAAWFDQPLTSQ